MKLQREEANIKTVQNFVPRITFKLNGQKIPESSYTTPAAVEYVDAGDDDEEGCDVLIPGDVRSLLKKITNAYEYSYEPDDQPEDDSSGDEENGADATDDEDAPDWEFDVNEEQSPNPTYEFCPAAHCKQLLSMITHHFCRHHFFPTRSGIHQSPGEIHDQCVRDMYMFCK